VSTLITEESSTERTLVERGTENQQTLALRPVRDDRTVEELSRELDREKRRRLLLERQVRLLEAKLLKARSESKLFRRVLSPGKAPRKRQSGR
jgi:predicted  nucleic acid-binding Zn-ribbon protein